MPAAVRIGYGLIISAPTFRFELHFPIKPYIYRSEKFSFRHASKIKKNNQQDIAAENSHWYSGP
jgi:hypothetical protein